MAVSSNMMPLGTKAPHFKLIDTVSNELKSLDDMKSGIATVVMFLCNHCPYVKHINHELVKLANQYLQKGISFIGISSNDIIKYPEDSPERMKEIALELKYPFPYLYDETQETAKAYNAACTPEFYIFDKNLLLVYRGQFDNSRPGSEIIVTGKDVKNALENILHGKEVDQNQIASIGCGIKWKH